MTTDYKAEARRQLRSERKAARREGAREFFRMFGLPALVWVLLSVFIGSVFGWEDGLGTAAVSLIPFVILGLGNAIILETQEEKVLERAKELEQKDRNNRLQEKRVILDYEKEKNL